MSRVHHGAIWPKDDPRAHQDGVRFKIPDIFEAIFRFGCKLREERWVATGGGQPYPTTEIAVLTYIEALDCFLFTSYRKPPVFGYTPLGLIAGVQCFLEPTPDPPATSSLDDPPSPISS